MARGIAVVVALLTAGTIANAQGFSWTPSFGTTQMYDDNLFYAPVGQSDTATRFAPRIDSKYESPRLTLSGGYELDADRFLRHPELTTVHGRQAANVDVRYAWSHRLSVDGGTAYTETQMPTDLNTLTGLAPGRVRAQRVTFHPSATYQAGPRTQTVVGYTVSDDVLSGGVHLVTQAIASSFEDHLSDRRDVRVEYRYERYLFQGAEAQRSQVMTAEWISSPSRTTELSLRAGPRLTDGAVSPEITASIRGRLRSGEVALTYLRTQTTLVGLAGVVDTSSVTATYGGEVRPRLTLRAGPGVMRTRQGGLSSTVSRLSVFCSRPIAKRLAVEAAYDLTLQRGGIYTGQVAAPIDRNLLSVTIVVANTAPAH